MSCLFLDDIGGWETVQKGGKVKGRNSPAQKPTMSLLNKAKKSPNDKSKPKDYQQDKLSSSDGKTATPASGTENQALKSTPTEPRPVAERVAEAWSDRVASLIIYEAPYGLPDNSDVNGSNDQANIGQDEPPSNKGPSDKSYEEEDLSSSDSQTEDEKDREAEAEDELNEQLENVSGRYVVAKITSHPPF